MVLEFCNQWRNANEIAHQIGRNRQHTQKRIIKELITKGALIMEFPETPTTPTQRYNRNESALRRCLIGVEGVDEVSVAVGNDPALNF